MTQKCRQSLKKKLPAHVTCNTCHLMIADVDRLKLDSPKHLIRLRKPFLNSKRSSRNDGSIPPVNLLVTTWTFLQVLQPGVVTLVKCFFFPTQKTADHSQFRTILPKWRRLFLSDGEFRAWMILASLWVWQINGHCPGTNCFCWIHEISRNRLSI